MKEIPLRPSGTTIVDDEDFDRLSQFTWYRITDRRGRLHYAQRVSQDGSVVMMHRDILGTPAGMLTDHWNGNGLDNQRKNLRVCTRSQNMQNRGKFKPASSKHKGVSWHSLRGKWASTIYVNKKKVGYRYFTDELEAAKHYNTLATEHFGEFARLNVV